MHAVRRSRSPLIQNSIPARSGRYLAKPRALFLRTTFDSTSTVSAEVPRSGPAANCPCVSPCPVSPADGCLRGLVARRDAVGAVILLSSSSKTPQIHEFLVAMELWDS